MNGAIPCDQAVLTNSGNFASIEAWLAASGIPQQGFAVCMAGNNAEVGSASGGSGVATAVANVIQGYKLFRFQNRTFRSKNRSNGLAIAPWVFEVQAGKIQVYVRCVAC